MKTASELTTEVLDDIKSPFARAVETGCCNKCGAKLDPAKDGTDPLFCAKCNKIFDGQEAERAAKNLLKIRIESWEKKCPPMYRDIDPAKLPNPAKLKEVLAWQCGAKGLLLHGDTRQGKSRCAYTLLKREHFAGRSVRILESTATVRFGALYAQGTDVVEEWMDDHIGCAVLLLDDFFKVKLSEALESTIFAVIEARIANYKPIIVTTNDTAATLKSRMSSDRGKPLMARLRECCEAITF